MHNSLFIFRRDLRITDNTALIKCNSDNKIENIIPVFILTPNQIINNNYKSDKCIQFMIESLIDLDDKISNHNSKLIVLFDDEITALSKLHKAIKFNKIYFNKDYTPYSIKRDKLIKKWSKDNSIECKSYDDILLINNMDKIRTKDGNIHKIYAHFYKSAKNEPIRNIDRSKIGKFIDAKIIKKIIIKNNIDSQNKFMLHNKYYEVSDHIHQHGGRKNGLKILKKIIENNVIKNYNKTRNIMHIETTNLSAHNKFGTLSIREVYNIVKPQEELVKQLYWRDFYYYICYYLPNIFKYDHIRKDTKYDINHLWVNSKKKFEAWCNGKTGFPIIDAAMNQLNITGYMHNRARLITSTFLVKDLHINWKYGEQYYASKLIDYDRCQNIGNWNFIASFGMDNSPYLRIFNPWTQAEKFDPECKYIKKWLPVLKDINNKHILKWYKYCNEYDNIQYYKPIVDHKVQRNIFIEKYNKIFK
jgi:deoxyribodipyrimidine photo-lyase